MIKVTYKSILKQDTIYKADGFHFKDGLPFKKSGLYITDGEKVVVFINDVESIHKVEYVGNRPQHVVFNMCDHLENYKKEEMSEGELASRIEKELKEYFGAERVE